LQDIKYPELRYRSLQKASLIQARTNHIIRRYKKIKQRDKNGRESSMVAIIRQWLSEGIPFAFKDCPGIKNISQTMWLLKEKLDITLFTQNARIGKMGK